MTSPPTQRLAMICSGNICRSPLAAVIAKHMMEERGVPGIVISAGTLGLVAHPAAENSVIAAEEIGLDLSEHRSQSANPGLLMMADAILVMSPEHTAALLRRETRLKPKIVELWRHYPADAPGAPLSEIADPVGKDLEAFRACREVIRLCLNGFFKSRGL